MKIPVLAHLLICFLGSFVCYWFGPWYCAAIFLTLWFAVFIVPTRFAILAGAGILALLHLSISGWMWMQDDTGLLVKAGTVLGGLPPIALWFVTGIVGFITGGLAGWLGTSIRSLFIQTSTT